MLGMGHTTKNSHNHVVNRAAVEDSRTLSDSRQSAGGKGVKSLTLGPTTASSARGCTVFTCIRND